ncbi:hypothetical protein BFS06_12385 [Clostridium perfringens]|uniref:Protein serine/threonine phosphatase PrpC, regulation of stationary phase n=1 Tax=Clostridium perfringens TaxID=1502 RepID=A0A140GR44_CLOPF|nr:metallophosphoesterase [Clostridium perfringens]AMN31003.1 protein serine/threonine phosphatase PrpC, regulation of stationary phase [Clostridium perfringens]TBX14999.1 hypothetical protein BFS06_12385 [Clostridium perfringens]
MIYVMSDIHGCFEKFILMLEKIKFSNHDKLYILGDILDKGDRPLEIYEYIKDKENIYLLKGNHEVFCEYALKHNEFNLWSKVGGATTLNQLNRKDKTYKDNLIKYIEELPLYKVVDNFLLVHAGVFTEKDIDTLENVLNNTSEDIFLWDKSLVDVRQEIKGYTIICGHTSTPDIDSSLNVGKIINHNNKIYIDCKVYNNEIGRLGCLRLNDMAEFYI